ncbi:coenzyme Q-binding protein COQ10 [Rhodopseudomonas julia]|uniref:Coenzyme Q-binding protein COQ10 n=1 Tax=Rhodopseudomonas julia TaxID=200617 RepID=A0ABU0CBJ1_9BRAD|nr:type II toxin-antitoxin system RatA family toxin [Rhodopseudomonas julia]MDQ0327557.1 coenzyme Q-binding protein COQ10 [Rhodopseudomonas julia]
MSRHLETTRFVALPQEEVFDLVSDVESYPEFLPGFLEARILERDGDALLVMQRVGLPGLTIAFRSRAELTRPDRLLITSHDKPFRSLRHEWHFEAIEKARTKVTMRVDFALVGAGFGGFKEAVVRQLYARSVEAFEARARERALAQARKIQTGGSSGGT